MSTSTITRAAQMLEQHAAELKSCHTLEDCWGDEDDARAAYDAEMALAAELRAMIAAAPEALDAFVARDESAPMVLPDGSAFGVISFPLPGNHWLYAPLEYLPGEDEPIELPTPCLRRTPENYERAMLAIRYAIRGATMCGKETDFDPDALVQNALYALLGPFPQRAMAADPEAPEQAGIPDGHVVVPLHMTAEMRRVTEADGWTWADLLAAAGAITELEYDLVSLREDEASGTPEQAAQPASPTAGMNLGQRIEHVGGRVTEDLRVEFGSVMAVDALVRQVLRDLPAQPADRWRQAIDGGLVAAFLGTAETFPDPIQALNALIDWHVNVALDPEVSSAAAALIERGRAEAQPADVARLVEVLIEYANPLNWDADEAGIRRVWREPASSTPEAYNGFELARAALAPKGADHG